MPAKKTKPVLVVKPEGGNSESPKQLKPLKTKALALELTDKSMLIIRDSDVKVLWASSYDTRNEKCKVNEYMTKESMDKIIERLGWECSRPLD